MGTGQVKRPQNLQFIRRFTHFSWINACQIVESLLLISRVLKKFILTIFASVAIALMEEWIFRGPYHAFPVVHSNSSHPLMAVLIYVSLMSNDVQDIFLCLLVICISFVMCLLKYFAYLKKQILPFYRWLVKVLHILMTRVLSHIYVLWILFFQSLPCLIISSMVCFSWQVLIT